MYSLRKIQVSYQLQFFFKFLIKTLWEKPIFIVYRNLSMYAVQEYNFLLKMLLWLFNWTVNSMTSDMAEGRKKFFKR